MNSVPFPGAIFLRPCNEYSKTKHSSRPLSGVSIFLPDSNAMKVKVADVLVPFPGFLSFYKVYDWIVRNNCLVLVPFPGFLSFYTFSGFAVPAFLFVLVPFPGFLSFYAYKIDLSGNREQFSSPFRGFYLSTYIKSYTGLCTTTFSSPFRGFYLSTVSGTLVRCRWEVLVPFPGFLSFYPSLYIPCYFYISNLFCGSKIKYLEITYQNLQNIFSSRIIT